MKKIIFIPILLFFACTEQTHSDLSETKKSLTREEVIRSNVEKILYTNLNDSTSYEFVSIEILDSVSYADNIEDRVKFFVKDLEDEKSKLDDQARYKSLKSYSYDPKSVEKIKQSIKRNEYVLAGIDSIKASLIGAQDSVASYSYLFKFRAANAFGAKVINSYIVQTDPQPSYGVINIAQNREKVYLTPNEFPGYRELVKKSYVLYPY